MVKARTIYRLQFTWSMVKFLASIVALYAAFYGAIYLARFFYAL